MKKKIFLFLILVIFICIYYLFHVSNIFNIDLKDNSISDNTLSIDESPNLSTPYVLVDNSFEFTISENEINEIGAQIVETRKNSFIKPEEKLETIETENTETETIENVNTIDLTEHNTEQVIDVSQFYIKADGNVDTSFLVKANNEYMRVPQNIRNLLQTNGCQIYVTDKNLAATYFPGYKSVQGVSDRYGNWIRIEDRDNAITGSLIHEIGHIIDGYVGLPSQSAEFINIYNIEKNTFNEVGKLDNHSTSSSLEYFAECFRQTILYPSTMQQSAPQTYQYILNIINSI